MGILQIPITKAGTTLAVDTETIPEDMYVLALAEGLKSLLNARMSKILTKDLEGEELAAARKDAMAIAHENMKKIETSTYKKGRSTGTTDATGAKVSREVMTEAMRLAKITVRDAARAANMKPSMIEAKVITAAAKEILAADPSYIEQAKLNIEARTAKPVPVAIDIKSLVSESPKLLKKAADEKAARKSTLSATQAGKVLPPKKGSKPGPALHA